MRISDHRKKLWLGNDSAEGQRRYLALRKEMRKYVVNTKLYDKKDFGAEQWQQFTCHLVNLKILEPVRSYLTGAPSEDNNRYRVALDKIMIDVLKKMRGSFKRIFGYYPTHGEDIDPSVLRLEDSDKNNVEGDENDASEFSGTTLSQTPALKRPHGHKLISAY
jgi:hypothetical protein